MRLTCYISIYLTLSAKLGLRCEWAKSKARADRWGEEVCLLVEEMRRVISFLDWKARWWTQQGNARSGLPDDLADGVAAYAAKQAHVNGALATSFASKWYGTLIENDLPVEWPALYNPTSSLATSGDSDVESQ